MYTRRLLLAAPLLVACKNPAEKAEVLPMSLGEFRRLNIENIPAEEHPEEYKRMGLKNARRAMYQGPARISATVYEMGGQAVAFELVQKWRPQPASISFQQGRFFVVLKSEPEDAKAMSALASSIEGVLKDK